MKSIALGVWASLIAAVPAHAQWNSKRYGPDVYGVTSVLAGTEGLQGTTLVVVCNDDGVLDLALLMPKSEFGEVAAHTTDFRLRVDDGEVELMRAEHRLWNNNYSAFVATSTRDATAALLERMSRAEEKVDVGASDGNYRLSFSFGAGGIREAMAEVQSTCAVSN